MLSTATCKWIIFPVISVCVLLAILLHASPAHGTDGVTTPHFYPVNEVIASESGYGGATGVQFEGQRPQDQDDKLFSDEPVLTFRVFFPTNENTPQDYGALYSQWKPNGSPDEPKLVTDTPLCEINTDQTFCEYKQPFSREDVLHYNGVFPGITSYYVEYTDHKGQKQRVSYNDGTTTSDTIDVNVIGKFTAPFSYFPKANTTISDPGVTTTPIDLHVRRGAYDISSVIFYVNDEPTTITDSVEISDDLFPEGTALRFRYDLDVESLEKGNYSIRADVFTKESLPPQPSATFTLDGRHRGNFAFLTLSTTQDARQQQKCEDNKSIIVELMRIIGSDASTQITNQLTNAANVHSYVEAQSLESSELDRAWTDIESLTEQLTILAERIESSGENFDCTIDTNQQIQSFTSDYTRWVELRNNLKSALIDYIDLIIEASNE